MKILFILIGLIISTIAYADCQKSYVCDNGRCGYVDICTDSFDTPSFNVPPIPALPPLEVKPPPSVEVPPIGTSKCRYMQVNGRWQNVCW